MLLLPNSLLAGMQEGKVFPGARKGSRREALTELWLLAPKLTLRERDRDGDGCSKWPGKAEGLGILGVEVRCKQGRGSSVGHGVEERRELTAGSGLSVSGGSCVGKGFDLFLLDFASQGQLHLKGVRRLILMIEVRALSIASDRNTTEMGLR